MTEQNRDNIRAFLLHMHEGIEATPGVLQQPRRPTMPNPYRCWCEWLGKNPYQPTPIQYTEKWREKQLEDARYHAYLEGRKLPTESELTALLKTIPLAIYWHWEREEQQMHVEPLNLEDVSRAILTYLEART